MLRLQHRGCGSAHGTCCKGAMQSLGALVFTSPVERTTLHPPQITPFQKSTDRKKQHAFGCTCRSPLCLPGEGMVSAKWSPGTFHRGLAFLVHLLCQARSWQCLQGCEILSLHPSSHLQQGPVSPSPTSRGKVTECSGMALVITIIILICSLGSYSLQAGPMGRERGSAFQNMTSLSPRPSFNENDNNKRCSLRAAFLLQHLPPVALHFSLAI